MRYSRIVSGTDKGHCLKAKLKRFLTSVLPVSPRRRGGCVDCGACCRLPTPCIFLGSRDDGGSYCRIYSIRPLSCRQYPRTPSEFITEETCGYWFEANPVTSKASDFTAVIRFHPTGAAAFETGQDEVRPGQRSPRGIYARARRMLTLALAQASWADLRSIVGSKSD